MAKTVTPASQTRISRDDLEAKFQALQGGIQGKVDDRKRTLMTAGIVVGVILLLIFFLLGRRSGKKKTTLVEIRRL
jgi:uncharacterized membrane protein YvbJ